MKTVRRLRETVWRKNDRELLVQFDNVIAEFKKLKPVYQVILRDITNKMGNSMPDYSCKAASGV